MKVVQVRADNNPRPMDGACTLRFPVGFLFRCVIASLCLFAVVTAGFGAATAQASPPSPSSPPSPRGVLLAVQGPGSGALRQRVQEAIVTSSTAPSLLDEHTLRLRMRGPMGKPLDLADVVATLSSAEAAFATLEYERSVALLEQAIEQLEADRDFSLEKQQLLEQTRLTCAQRLVALAGPAETGRTETANGRRARHHLAQMLRVHPRFALDVRRHPPKMHSLLALAAADVREAGMASLQVESPSPGAQVRIDGRLVGRTPLTFSAGVPAGRYRLWLEAGADRSFTRTVEFVRDRETPIDIDVAFEGAFRPLDLALRPSRPFHPTDWMRAAGLLDVDVIHLVGVEVDDGGEVVVWGASIDGRTGQVMGGVRSALRPEGSNAAPAATQTTTATTTALEADWSLAIQRIAAFIVDGVGEADFVAPMSIVAVPGTTPATDDDDTPSSMLLPALIGAAIGVVVIGAGMGLVLSWPR
jgi:hypothetical protein